MSKLYYAGQASMKRACIKIMLKDESDIVKRLVQLEDKGEVAIKRTVSDFVTRAPAWVSKGIRKHYGVDKKAITEAEKKTQRGKTSFKVGGITVDGATLEYEGENLTPIHFNMKPSTRNPRGQSSRTVRIPGQAIATARNSPVAMVAPPNPYTVKATIIKGQKTAFSEGTYLASAHKGGGDATPIIPFQRTGAGRTPVHAIHTLSVPQMIDGRAHETINELINEGLEKRFANHIKQAMK